MATKRKKEVKKVEKRPLSLKQMRFCEEYIVDLNGQEAYRRAGYKAKTREVASTSAARLLSDVRIQERIQAALKARQKRLNVDQDYVINRLQREVELCGDSDTPNANRIRALELLGKHLGMFAEQFDHHHSGHTTHAHAHAHALIDDLPLPLKIQILQHYKQQGLIDIGGPDAEEPPHVSQLGEDHLTRAGGTPLVGHDPAVPPGSTAAQARQPDPLPAQAPVPPVGGLNGAHPQTGRGDLPAAR